jgi:rubrerythrin
MNSIAKSGTPSEILEAALKKERAAYDFYAEVRDHAKVDMVKALAEQLCEEEHRHIRMIEKHILDLKLG